MFSTRRLIRTLAVIDSSIVPTCIFTILVIVNIFIKMKDTVAFIQCYMGLCHYHCTIPVRTISKSILVSSKPEPNLFPLKKLKGVLYFSKHVGEDLDHFCLKLLAGCLD